MKHNSLIERITEAFSSVEYPGDMNLVKGMDEYADAYEMFEAFRGKRWQDIGTEVAEYWRMDVVKFTPEGFQYYLPAFLIAALDDEPTEIGSYLVATVKPKSDEAAMSRLLNRISKLNKSQKAAVYEFLKDFFEDNPKSTLNENNQSLDFWLSLSE